MEDSPSYQDKFRAYRCKYLVSVIYGGIWPQFGQPTFCSRLHYDVTMLAESRCLLTLMYLLT